jgi:hypothetical protein
MRAHSAGVVTGIASVVFFITSVLAAQPGKLAPDAIVTTFFTGQPFTASTTSNVKFKMTFTADNKMKREPSKGGGGGARGEGTWKLSTDGFCTTWKGAKENCFTVIPAGDNKWSVMKGSSILATWNK